jgi:hypothetical protein
MTLVVVSMREVLWKEAARRRDLTQLCVLRPPPPLLPLQLLQACVTAAELLLSLRYHPMTQPQTPASALQLQRKLQACAAYPYHHHHYHYHHHHHHHHHGLPCHPAVRLCHLVVCALPHHSPAKLPTAQMRSETHPLPGWSQPLLMLSPAADQLSCQQQWQPHAVVPLEAPHRLMRHQTRGALLLLLCCPPH